MSRARRKIPSLQMEERAIIRTWERHGEEAMAAKHYATAVDFTARGLHIYSDMPLPRGEVIDIDILLQGQSHPYTLKGIARTVTRSDTSFGYLVEVDLVSDESAGRWRRQFH